MNRGAHDRGFLNGLSHIGRLFVPLTFTRIRFAVYVQGRSTVITIIIGVAYGRLSSST
jgi:hypothetical protein